MRICGFSVLFSFALLLATQHVMAEPQDDITHAIEKGQRTFLRFCSVCHAQDGTGKDTGLHHLKTVPPDLTQISQNNEGSFPWKRLFRVINGQEFIPAHGDREMPKWGELFDLHNWGKQNPEFAEEIVHGRILELLLYLDSIQDSSAIKND